jgi:hypothetical protein
MERGQGDGIWACGEKTNLNALCHNLTFRDLPLLRSLFTLTTMLSECCPWDSVLPFVYHVP